MSEDRNWITRISGVFRGGNEDDEEQGSEKEATTETRDSSESPASSRPSRESLERALVTRQARVKELEEQLATRDDAVGRARHQLRNTMGELEALRQDHEELHRMYADTVSSRKDAAKRVETAEKQSAELTEKLERADVELRRAKIRLATSEGDRENLSERLSRVEEALSSAEARLSEAARDFAKAEEQRRESSKRSLAAKKFAGAEAKLRAQAEERERHAEARYVKVLHTLVGPELVHAAFALAGLEEGP